MTLTLTRNPNQVKRFKRPDAGAPPPAASELRPLPVLRHTVDFLLQLWQRRSEAAPLDLNPNPNPSPNPNPTPNPTPNPPPVTLGTPLVGYGGKRHWPLRELLDLPIYLPISPLHLPYISHISPLYLTGRCVSYATRS